MCELHGYCTYQSYKVWTWSNKKLNEKYNIHFKLLETTVPWIWNKAKVTENCMNGHKFNKYYQYAKFDIYSKLKQNEA